MPPEGYGYFHEWDQKQRDPDGGYFGKRFRILYLRDCIYALKEYDTCFQMFSLIYFLTPNLDFAPNLDKNKAERYVLLMVLCRIEFFYKRFVIALYQKNGSGNSFGRICLASLLFPYLKRHLVRRCAKNDSSVCRAACLQ